MKKVILTTLFLFLVVVPANATLIGSYSIVRADFDLTSKTPPPPYDLMSILIEFDTSIDGGQPGEKIRTSLFDYSDNLIKSTTTIFPPFWSIPPDPLPTAWAGLYEVLDFGSHIYTPHVGDYIILDNIVGSFDLTIIRPSVRVFESSDNYAFTSRVDSEITVSTIPEPATMLLFGFGLLGVAGVSRKKNSKNI
jgi:hypothetical protein